MNEKMLSKTPLKKSVQKSKTLEQKKILVWKMKITALRLSQRRQMKREIRTLRSYKKKNADSENKAIGIHSR